LQRALDIVSATKMAILDQQQGAFMSNQTDVHGVSFAIAMGRENIWLASADFTKKFVLSAGSRATYEGCAKRTKLPNRPGVKQIDQMMTQ